MPELSQARWVLVPKPPRRGACAGLFFRPGGGSAGAGDGGSDAPQVALDQAAPIQAEQQGVEDVGPGAVLAPAVEAVVDGLPAPVAFGGCPARGAGVQVPEDAVD